MVVSIVNRRRRAHTPKERQALADAGVDYRDVQRTCSGSDRPRPVQHNLGLGGACVVTLYEAT